MYIYLSIYLSINLLSIYIYLYLCMLTSATRMFSSLRSRCTMPCRCMYSMGRRT